MKNVFILLSLVLCCSLNIQAQDELTKNKGMDGLYFTLKGGFTTPVSQSTVGSPREELGDDLLVFSDATGVLEYSEKNPFGSRGAGGTLAAALGYMFNDNFGVEMEFSFIRTLTILDAKTDIDTGGVKYFAEQTSHTNMLRAAPMLVVSGNKGKKVRPYAKFGLLIPLAGGTIASVTINDESGTLADQLLPVIDNDLYTEIQDSANSFLGQNIAIPTSSNIKATTSGQFSLGFTAKFGAEFKISDKVSLFGELEMNMLTVKAKQTKFTEFSSGVSDPALVDLAEGLLGREIQSDYTLQDIPEILRLTEYQNEITENSNNSYEVGSTNYKPNEPYEQLVFRDNYNSFGIMFGMKYDF